uniref:Uncharacterized protein n=1 Tax=Phytophthora ramorum TaxID=164328 RepID=H3GL84_PHYRM
MPRPILKTLSSYASPMRPSDSASKRENKRVVIQRHSGLSRRVTFSPFTKLREGTPTNAPPLLLTDGEETKGSLTSGFTFSSATETEKNVKSLLLANIPGLKRLDMWASDWLDYVKSVRKSMPWPRRTRPKRRPRRLLRGPWTELDDADHKYVQQLALSSITTHPTLLATSSTSSDGCNPLDVVQSSPLPDLTPARRGSFTSLLRREGIPVDEDERQVNRAIGEDLRGVNHRSKRKRRASASMGNAVSALVFQPPPATYGYTRRYFFLVTAMHHRIPAFFIPYE